MFGIGETELVIIVVFAFLLFGPDKLPGMGRTLGRVLRQFREASDGFTEVVQTNIMDPASEELQKSPKQRRREEEEAAGGTDADVSSAGVEDEGAAEKAPRRETFAERKARLKAEREAAQAAGATQASSFAADDEAGESAAGADSDEDLPGSEPTLPARTTAADLYAISGKSARLHANDKNEGAPHATADEVEEGAVASSSSVSPDTKRGEEDGSAEA